LTYRSPVASSPPLEPEGGLPWQPRSPTPNTGILLVTAAPAAQSELTRLQAQAQVVAEAEAEAEAAVLPRMMQLRSPSD